MVSEEATSLLARLKEQESYRASEQGGRLLHSWQDEDGDPEERVFAYMHTFEGVSNRLVFLSNQSAEVMGAVDVLEGKRRSITDVADGRLSARPRPGSFFYLETSEQIPGLDAVEQLSAVATLARGLRLDFGETAGKLSLDLVVTTANAGDALKLSSVLQGITALVGLLGSDRGGPELQGLLNALRFTANGNELGLQFVYDSRRLIELVEAHGDR